MFTRISKGVLIAYFILVVFMGIYVESNTGRYYKGYGIFILIIGLIFGYLFGLFVELINNVLDLKLSAKKIEIKLAEIQHGLTGNNQGVSNITNMNTSNNNRNEMPDPFDSMQTIKNANVSSDFGEWNCRRCLRLNDASSIYCIQCGTKRD